MMTPIITIGTRWLENYNFVATAVNMKPFLNKELFSSVFKSGGGGGAIKNLSALIVPSIR